MSKSMDDVSVDSLFSMFKGEPGLRKSTSALSYPTPQYWFSFDQKMEALKLPMSKWGVKAKEVQFDDYTDFSTARDKMEQFRLNCPFKTIIVDSVTSLGDAMNRETIKAKGNNKEGSGKKIGKISVPGIEEYNAEASAFNDMIAVLKDIQSYHKCHIILIAHVVGQRKDSDSNKLTHHSRVIITGGDKIAGKIASQMVEVYHFNVKSGMNVDAGDDKFQLFTSHTGNDYARTSLPLPKEITFNDDPLYDKYILPAITKLNKEVPIEKFGTNSGIQTPKPSGFGAQ